MTEHEELLMLRALVEKQKKEIEQKDDTIRRQNIQIESMLHARKKRFGRSSEATEFSGQLNLFETNEKLAKALEEASR